MKKKALSLSGVVNYQNTEITILMRPTFYIHICGFLYILLLFSPALVEPSPGRINVSVGFFSPLSGSLSVYGEEMLNGSLLAIEQINSRTNMNLSLLIRDSKGNSEIAAQIASYFSEKEEVVAVVGGFKSDCNMVAAPILDKAGILMISPTESHSGFTSIGSNIFRANATQINEAEFMSQWAEDMGFESFVSIYIDDQWGNNANNLFVISSREKNIILQAEFPIGPDFQKFDAFVEHIQAKEIDFIYSILFHKQACKLFNSLKEHGVTKPILAASSLLSDEITANSLSCSMDIMSPSSFPLEDKKSYIQRFNENYSATFNKKPSLYAALAFDSIHLVYIAITNSTPERYELKNGMKKIFNYQGITGLFSFTEGRSPGKKLYRMTLEDHRWTPWRPRPKFEPVP